MRDWFAESLGEPTEVHVQAGDGATLLPLQQIYKLPMAFCAQDLAPGPRVISVCNRFKLVLNLRVQIA